MLALTGFSRVKSLFCQRKYPEALHCYRIEWKPSCMSNLLVREGEVEGGWSRAINRLRLTDYFYLLTMAMVWQAITMGRWITDVVGGLVAIMMGHMTRTWTHDHSRQQTNWTMLAGLHARHWYPAVPSHHLLLVTWHITGTLAPWTQPVYGWWQLTMMDTQWTAHCHWLWCQPTTDQYPLRLRLRWYCRSEAASSVAPYYCSPVSTTVPISFKPSAIPPHHFFKYQTNW